MKNIIHNTQSSLRERLDFFLLYIQEEKTLKGYVLARELEISIAMVDIFFKLIQLEEKYPDRIIKLEKARNHSGLLSILSSLHFSSIFFNSIFSRIDDILNMEKPCEYIFQLIEKEQQEEYSSLDKLESKYLYAIAKLLKQRNINVRQLNVQLRKFLVLWGKKLGKGEKISLGGKSSIIKAVIQDYEQDEGVFVNDDLQEKFPESVKIVEDLIKLMELDKSVDVESH